METIPVTSFFYRAVSELFTAKKYFLGKDFEVYDSDKLSLKVKVKFDKDSFRRFTQGLYDEINAAHLNSDENKKLRELKNTIEKEYRSNALPVIRFFLFQEFKSVFYGSRRFSSTQCPSIESLNQSFPKKLTDGAFVYLFYHFKTMDSIFLDGSKTELEIAYEFDYVDIQNVEKELSLDILSIPRLEFNKSFELTNVPKEYYKFFDILESAYPSLGFKEGFAQKLLSNISRKNSYPILTSSSFVGEKGRRTYRFLNNAYYGLSYSSFGFNLLYGVEVKFGKNDDTEASFCSEIFLYSNDQPDWDLYISGWLETYLNITTKYLASKKCLERNYDMNLNPTGLDEDNLIKYGIPRH